MHVVSFSHFIHILLVMSITIIKLGSIRSFLEEITLVDPEGFEPPTSSM